MDSYTPSAALAQPLRNKQNAWAATADATTARLYEDDVAELAARGLHNRALQLGYQVPGFDRSNALNQPVPMATLRHGPVVLAWYRGA